MVDTVVLVEGASDQQALLALAARLDRDLEVERVEIVAMGGATSIGHYVRRYGPRGLDRYLVALCDAAEHHLFAQLLDPADIFVCDADLEDELLRAMGLDDMLAFIESQGELRPFRTLQKQPAQRERSVEQHLHRFCGIRAGRKARYARGMVEWLPLERVPKPLMLLLESV